MAKEKKAVVEADKKAEYITVVANAKATHLIEGKEYTLNPHLAQKLLDTGVVNIK